MTMLLTASQRNTVVLNWSGQEGVSFNSLGFFFVFLSNLSMRLPF